MGGQTINYGGAHVPVAHGQAAVILDDEIAVYTPGAQTGTIYPILPDGSVGPGVIGLLNLPEGVGPISASNFASVTAKTAPVGSIQFGQLFDVVGSALGHVIGADNAVEGIVYSSLLGELGQRLGAHITSGSEPDALLATSVQEAGAAVSPGTEFANRLGNATIGSVSTLLTAELGEAFGLKGFGAELFDTVGSTVLQRAISNTLTSGATHLFDGFHFNTIGDGFGSDAFGANGVGTLLANAAGAFLGAKLGELVVHPNTQAAEILSSVGAAAGAYEALAIGDAIADSYFGGELTTLGNLVLPGVGAFVGFVLGALIGNLFGHKKPRIPTANAQTVLNLPFANYTLGAVTSANGGSADLVKGEALAAADMLNGLIAEVTGGLAPSYVANGNSPTQVYGHTGNQLWVKLGGTSASQINVDSGDQAVDQGVLWALPQTQIIGGDIFIKRAIAHTAADSVAALAGDIQIAGDYSFYAHNRGLIDGYITGAYTSLSQAQMDYYGNNKALIDKVDTQGVAALNSTELSTYNANQSEIAAIVRALQNQSIANPWIITLQRASELGLMNWSPSDFNGGLGGFLQSFGLETALGGASGAHAENTLVFYDGSTMWVQVQGALGPGTFSILPQATSDGSMVTIGSFASTMGYTNWTGVASGGNDIASASGSAAHADFEATGPSGTDRDVLFIGGNGGNTLSGGAGSSWLQGGTGTDVITAGTGFNTIIAGSGSATIQGGGAQDYIAAGSGNDVIYAGGGQTTVVGGVWNPAAGSSSVYGNSGGTLSFVASNGGTFTWVFGTGSNSTISFERYAQGVTANLGNTGQFSWIPTAGVFYNIAFNNVQNLIGSSFNDVLQTSSMGGILEGGAGADHLIGGGASTTASYLHSAAGVYVDLSTGTALGGDAEGDTFTNLQNLTGSNFSDELKGLHGSLLNGGAGDDWLDYSGGANQFIGGDGSDTIDYSAAPTFDGTYGVYVDLRNNAAYWTATGDTYSSIEQVIGTAFSDVIYGTDNDTTFQGGASTNYLYGGTGSDTYVVNVGDGAQIISDSNSASNAIQFGAGVAFHDLWLGTVGGASGYLQLGIRGTNAYAQVQGNFGAFPIAGNDIAKVLSLDGSDSVDIGQITFGVGGDDNSNTLAGQATAYNAIFGYGGADLIYGSSGQWSNKGSFIVGGTGDDYIVTSAGDDQFGFDRGDGRDEVVDSGGEDSLIFGPTVAADDVIYQVVGSDLYIGIRDLTNTTLTASQVADSVLVSGGAIEYENLDTGQTTFNTIEFVQAGGSSIDVRKLNLNWVVQYTGGGGGGFQIPPIVFDLTGDGLELTPVADSNIVTVDGNGIVTRTSWVGPTNGILAFDRNGDGRVDSISEISFVGDTKDAKTDLQGLVSWDTNGDGVLDAKDANWGKLVVWVDANQDGQSQPDEIKSLAQIGIVALSLTAAPTGFDGTDTIDSFVTNTAAFTRADGTTGMAYDVSLARRFLGAKGIENAPDVTWGDLTADGQIGQLQNDPLAEAQQSAVMVHEDIAENQSEIFRPAGAVVDPAAIVAAAADGSARVLSQLAQVDLSGQDKPISDAAAARWANVLHPDQAGGPDAQPNSADNAALLDSVRGNSTNSGGASDLTGRGVAAPANRMQGLVLDPMIGAAQMIDPANSTVRLDVNADGSPDHIGWVAAGSGLIGYDSNGNHLIDGAQELGFLAQTRTAKTLIDALKVFDSNADGTLNSSDVAFGGFMIWHDVNQDGISEDGETQTLTQAGIVSIDLMGRNLTPDNKNLGVNQSLGQLTATFADGSNRIISDIAFGIDNSNDVPATPATKGASASPRAPTAMDMASLPARGTLSGADSTPSDTSATHSTLAMSADVGVVSGGLDGPQPLQIAAPATANGAEDWWRELSSGAGVGSLGFRLSVAPNLAPSLGGGSTDPARITPINDAATLQRQMLLRQSIAAFQGGDDPGSAALWTRRAVSDGLSTLAAAVEAKAGAVMHQVRAA